MSDWINCFCLQKACVHSREWQGITAPLWSWEASTVFVVVSGGRAAGAGHERFILFREKHIFKSICGYGHRVWFSRDKNLIKKNNPLLSSSPTCMPDSFCASSYISVSFLPQRRFKSWTRPCWWWMICKPSVSVCLGKKSITCFWYPRNSLKSVK